MDSALNAQIEILRKVFDFREFGAGHDGPSALIDPRMADTAAEVGPPIILAAAAMRPEGLVGRRSAPAARTAVSPDLSSPSRDIAIGIARRPDGNGNDFLLSVLYQDRKLSKHKILDRIAGVAKGEVDVRYAGRVRALASWHRNRVDPLQVGAGCGHANVTVGTLGFFAEDAEDRGLGIVSNNHVLADVNSGQIGDPIRQPGRYDGGHAGDAIGTLERFVTIQFGGIVNFLDCAWARLQGVRGTSPADLIDGAEAQVGRIASTTPVTLMPGDLVVKNGRTTNYTQGQVMAINVVNLGVDMGGGLVARFDDQIRIESVNNNSFSEGGDSGSLILRNDGAPGALLFAGSGQGGTLNQGMTFANPLDKVLEQLKVEMVI